MNKQELVNNCVSTLGGGQDAQAVELMIHSALAFVNSYTFQDYSFHHLEQVPHAICFAIIDLVKLKHTQKLGISAERLSDYAITYRNEEIPHAVQVVLDSYRRINVI